MYTSDNLGHKTAYSGCFKRLCAKFRKQKSLLDLEITNDTSSFGYAGLQLMKGKIIAIDNTLAATKNMVVKENYILAHSSSVEITRN